MQKNSISSVETRQGRQGSYRRWSITAVTATSRYDASVSLDESPALKVMDAVSMEYHRGLVVAQMLELVNLSFSATLLFNTSKAAFFLHQ
jgi:hypothetical protein